MKNISDLMGSKTRHNLIEAFFKEAWAYFRYAGYSANAEGTENRQIASVFRRTSLDKMEHAKMLFEILQDTEQYDTAVILKDAVNDNTEGGEIYSDYTRIANEEGFSAIATVLGKIKERENQHSVLYRKLAANNEGALPFSESGEQVWCCANCGHIVIDKKAPIPCPACNNPKAFFSIEAQEQRLP